MTTKIVPVQSVVPPTGGPPSFRVSTDADRALFDVELATDPLLLGAALKARRTPLNYHSSADEAKPPALKHRKGSYTLDAGAWQQLRGVDYLYYRATSFDGTRAAPKSVERTPADANLAGAPFLRVSSSAAGLATTKAKLSGRLPWLSVVENRLLDDNGDVVVLRGVNRSGLQYELPGALDPTGHTAATSLGVAGITQAEIREIVHDWGANVLRLPLDQRQVLSDGRYRQDLDQVVAWAAAEGAYTVLCLHWLDTTRTFGHDAQGAVNHLAPLPEENSIRLWSALATWYARQPAVLFDLYNEPHEALPDDQSFLFERPQAPDAWVRLWHAWARRLEDAIHRVHPRALVLVSGWDWGLDLRGCPVAAAGGPLPNAVYSSHAYRDRTGAGAGAFDTYFGFPGLRSTQPVFVGEWGGGDADTAWGATLEGYLRERHRYRNGTWQGLAGWTAWAWGDDPHLVVRRTRKQGAKSWRPYQVTADGKHVPTAFGALVERALHTQPYAPDTVGALDRYGGYDLQLGDDDATATFGGFPRAAGAGENVPAPGAVGYVRQLQRDLATLGFPIVGAESGTFSRTVEFAVREFQSAARRAGVAHEVDGQPAVIRYAERLSAIANPDAYDGPVSGVVNTRTRALLSRWLADRLRCPITFELWDVDAHGARTALRLEKVARFNEIVNPPGAKPHPILFARDLSGYYAIPAAHAADDVFPVGVFVSAGWGGGLSEPPKTTWPEGELLPEVLVGKQLAGLTAAERSTYKVVRACAEVECVGFADCLNAWDNAILSQGCCHWTLGICGPKNVNAGELTAYLAYLRSVEPATFERVVGAFGVRTEKTWERAKAPHRPDGGDLWDSSQRKFTGRLALQLESTDYAPLTTRKTWEEWFRAAPWFYRFQMAGRTIPEYRLRMWDMARIRLRDIRAAVWGAGVPPVPIGGGATRPATVGDVFTSEKALALAMRWHIWRPADVISGGAAGVVLRDALLFAVRQHYGAAVAALPAGAGDPTQWAATWLASEELLVAGVVDRVDQQIAAAAGPAKATWQSFKTTLVNARDFPIWTAAANPRHFALDPAIGKLDSTRSSFAWADAGLPPAVA